jgi:N-methylhydantoinase B
VGLGANAKADGGVAMCFGQSAARMSPAEVWESQTPRLVEKAEFRTDSGGPGKHQGGPGIDYVVRVLEDCFATTFSERTKTPPPGLAGGGTAMPASVHIEWPDGKIEAYSKASGVKLPKGTQVHFFTGGGGGWGEAQERDPQAVKRDVLEGYVTEQFARENYPHAYE